MFIQSNSDRIRLAGILALVMVSLAAGRSQNDKEGTKSSDAQVQLHGKVICLAEELHRLYQTDLPTNHQHLYGLKTKEETLYTLLRTKNSEALFADPRVREKDLILKGRLFPKSHVFEAITLHSVRNGIVHDLYYWCDICSIQTIAPEPCPCCHGPVELVEKPLAGQ
jgi:hypothetical protein